MTSFSITATTRSTSSRAARAGGATSAKTMLKTRTLQNLRKAILLDHNGGRGAQLFDLRGMAIALFVAPQDRFDPVAHIGKGQGARRQVLHHLEQVKAIAAG